ncbi:MAG TPA: PAS domain-containing protein [Methanoregula sp.]|nr:PAS domain-containing protein [Methanoregula sp.]
MKTVCTFCNSVIDNGNSPGEPLNHGVCGKCYRRILADFGLNIHKFLELLDAPVFLVDEDVNVLAANSRAIAAFGKPVELVQGKLCGSVLDCINALLPEGCGKTPSCPDCDVRNAVNETFRTGKKIDNRPVEVHRKHKKPGRLLVSTRRENNVVLLRLEFAGTG